ncbi:hypothetical protein ACF0H5_023040 [Mactra antiquata]
MAAVGVPPGAGPGTEEWEKVRKIRRVRELFHGRFTDDQSGALLRHHNYNVTETVNFILDASPGQIHEVLGEEQWQVVGVRRDEVLRDIARRGEIGAEFRQFACQLCDNMWWRKVPTRKPVARCNGPQCNRRRRYKPIPRDEEYGWAKFYCGRCNKEFHAFAMMELRILGLGLIGKSQNYCYSRHCNNICEPEYILPPLKHRRPNRRIKHYCSGYNCYNRCPPPPGTATIPICVHPKSLQRRVHGPGSDLHTSTGSTVKTFLTQDELMPPYSPYEPSMADLSEDDGTDDDDNH